ncbi:TldD/PmbA family protein [Ochrobactrum cytisi]|nr:TldD/PmbA family protein [Brucella cytisi]
MISDNSAEKLVDRAAALVAAAKRAGADYADAVVMRARSVSVSVRLGKVEGTESSESDDFALRVFVGRRIASVSANASADPDRLAERAVAMARVAPEDPYEQLADPSLLVVSARDLDLYDSTDIDSERLTQDALATEAAALAVKGVTNSGEQAPRVAWVVWCWSRLRDFSGHYAATRFGRSVSAIAGEGTKMERDYDFSSRLHFSDLDTPSAIGSRAGERAVRRLDARQAKTGPVTVVYDPRLARGIAGHLASAINGASVARKTSFLRDSLGKQVLKQGINVTDNPLRVRGSSSRPFDGEGIEGQPLTMVEDGILNQWLLSGSSARELGLQGNGRGVRSGSGVSPASTNFAIEPGSQSPDELISAVGTGFT